MGSRTTEPQSAPSAAPAKRGRPRGRASAARDTTVAGGSDAPAFDAMILDLMKKLSGAVSNFVDGHTEVVIHDLRHPETSIVSIFNGHVSGRRLGDSVLAGPSGDKALLDIVSAKPTGPEHQVVVFESSESRSRDGTPLVSSSVVAYDGDGPIAAFCINVDLGAKEHILRELTGLLLPVAAGVLQPEPRSQNMEELIVDIIESSLEPKDVPTSRMTKQEKLASVDRMQRRGLFLIRGAVERVAKRMGATKFTIYNYLDELGARHSKE